jgi:eukaryotic-like serine/threonine-protein kinase
VTPTRPTKIGKYEVERLVGEGAMGVVYRATDPILNRPVAIKVMSDALAQDTDLRERFLREARAAGSLQHPNVITIYDFGEVDGHPYIAMEFVAGSDLEELLARHVPLTVDHALELMTGVLQGLGYAHKRGIVHRDVKPANIRVDDEGKARLMDFGVAHLTSSSMTRTGVMLGTPSYMAPEQIVGEKIGPATDIFSVGAVLYELLSGARPFQGDTLQSVMYKVLNEMPPSLAKVAPRAPPQLDRIVTRALAKDPADRYESALEMANDLIAVRASLHVGAQPAHMLSLRATIDSALASERSAATTRRRRRITLYGGGGAVAAAVLLVAGWTLARRTAHAPPAPFTATQAAAPRTDSGAPASNRPSKPQVADLAPHPSAPNAQTRNGRNGETAETRQKPRPPDAGASRLVATDAPPTVARSATVGATPPRSDTIAQQNAAVKAPTSIGGALPAGDARQPASTPPSSAPATTPPSAGTGASSAPVPVPPAPSVSPPAKPDANAPAEIAATVDAYARAIESRDIVQLRLAYPALTASQQRAFADFFSGTRSLRASLQLSNLRVDGTDATAKLSGAYDFVTTDGRSDRQDVTLQVELRWSRGAWHLVAVR